MRQVMLLICNLGLQFLVVWICFAILSIVAEVVHERIGDSKKWLQQLQLHPLQKRQR